LKTDKNSAVVYGSKRANYLLLFKSKPDGEKFEFFV